MTGFAITKFGGILPIIEPRKLPPAGSTSAVDSDLEATDLRCFAPTAEIGHVASVVQTNRTGFVFDDERMFVFSQIVEATYGPIRAEDPYDDRVFISSGFQAYPTYSTLRLGLPTPITPYLGPPLNWRKLGVPAGPAAPIVSIPAPLNGVAKLYAGNPTILRSDGSVLDMAGSGDTIQTGSRIRLSAAADEDWLRVNNNVYLVTRKADEDDPYYYGYLSLGSLDTTDILDTGEIQGKELLNGNTTGPYAISDQVNFTQEFEVAEIEDRFYVYTLVTNLGEEGPPSEPSEMVSAPHGTPVTVQTPSSITEIFTEITHKRIYRTVPTTSGTAQYYFVAEIPLSQEVYVDELEAIELGELLQSLEWYAPPEDLVGLTVLPNGVMAGFRDRELWLSEPYQPHAWPPSYVKTMDNEIIGIAAFGQQLVVGTRENPYVGTATDPLSMTFSKLQTVEPCISRRAIQSVGFGVIYPSPNGLILVGPGDARNMLADVWDEKAWRGLFSEFSEHFAAVHDSRYYLTFVTLDPVTSYTYIFDPTSNALEISTTSPDTATGAMVDRDEDRLFLLATRTAPHGPRVMEWNPDDPPETVPAVWRSRMFVMPQPLNMGAFQLFYDHALAASTGFYPVIEFYADGVLRSTRTVNSDEPMRLPGGFLAREWQVQITTRVPVQSLYVAETVAELRGAMVS